MTQPVRLVLDRQPVRRSSLGPMKARRPDVAVVYATAAGEVAVLDDARPMYWTEAVMARYRFRYEVDLGDHRRTVELRSYPLPARGEVYSFVATVEVGFRVSDPGEIIKRRVDDALVVVYNHILAVAREITREYAIEDSGHAEDALNARFRRGEVLEEGIDLYRCRARLRPDDEARRYLDDQERARRTNTVHAAEHVLVMDDSRRAQERVLLDQQTQLEVEVRRHRAIAGRPMDLRSVLQMHLERNPGDTMRALEMLLQVEQAQACRREEAEARAGRLFEFMVDRNLVQPVDVGPLRRTLLGDPGAAPTPLLPAGPAAGASSWDEPLPPLPGPAGGGAATVAELRPAGEVVPVYVLLDQSDATRDGIEELNTGLAALQRTLLAETALARVVRLSVVGYADDVAVHLQLSMVAEAMELPRVSAGGQARYGEAFRFLLERIPQDVDLLKRRSYGVRRPQVLFLTGAEPEDAASWGPVHADLVDRHRLPCAPDIVAGGVGAASARTVAQVATRPELAFVAPGGDVGRAVERYFAFVAGQVLGYGRAVLEGSGGPLVQRPEGFRPALELP